MTIPEVVTYLKANYNEFDFYYNESKGCFHILWKSPHSRWFTCNLKKNGLFSFDDLNAKSVIEKCKKVDIDFMIKVIESYSIYKQSEKWDMNKSAQDLFDNADHVLLNMKYCGHSSDNGYGGICIYVPNESDGYHIITIDEDSGLCYDGDSYIGSDNIPKLIKMKPKEAYDILVKWGALLNARIELENLLVANKNIEDDYVSINIDKTYNKNK